MSESMLNPIHGPAEVPESPRAHDTTAASMDAAARREVPKGSGSGAAHASVKELAPEPAPELKLSSAQVTFSVDAQLREMIIKVSDAESGKVIREIPSEQIQKVKRAYVEEMKRAEARQGDK